MKCPNCGAKMPEHSLYCEHCGEDIHIVPDFEPELELNIEKIINGIAEEAFEEADEGGRRGKRNKRTGVKKRVRGTVLGAVGILLLLVGVICGFLVYQHYSTEYQVARAEQCVEHGQYDKAVGYYNRALELEQDSITLKFALAEVYFLKNNKIEYEYLLRSIVHDEKATTEQLESAYGKLIAIYRAREDYRSINELLMASSNETVKLTYQDYIAMKPEFSVKYGFYTSVQPLKITAVGKGKIYYTMDGSTPTTESTQYTAPIILEEGDYFIKAYFVNENGIGSDVATGEYHIEIDEIPEPEVSAFSGDYSVPTYIEILGDEEDVYYTTDGTIPTASSAQYTEPISMPLGKSVFKFARIVDGVTGNVAECNYNLVLNTEYTPEQAQADVADYVCSTGKIGDTQGHFDDSGAMYKYQYQAVISINDEGHYYVIAEILQDAEGVLTKTGNHFAVNVYTGELFKLQKDGNNNYTLVEIQRESQE